MRIAFFVYEYPPTIVGGLGTYAAYITHTLVRQGHEVVVFTMNPGATLKKHEVIGGVEVHRPVGIDATNVFPLMVNEELRQWGSFFNDVFIYNTLCAAKFVNQVVQEEGQHFDVVAVHDWLSAIAGLVVRNETALPVVYHVHSTEWGRRGDAGSPFVGRLEWEIALRSTRIITVSHAMKDDLNRHGWPPHKVSVVWNGVDPEVYDTTSVPQAEVQDLRTRYGIGPDDTMLLFVGRLTWVKGVRNLIQAMPAVVEAYPRTKLVILGKGEEQHDVDELVHRLGLGQNVVTHYAFVSERERIAHYAAADACIFPSVYEPFGIVSLETMAMGKPLVVGANGVVGFREQVTPAGADQNGIHINGNDPGDIAWGVKTLLADPDRAREMGAHGRTRVMRYFTWEQVAKQTIEVYEQVVAGGAQN
jgi:glycosyltransferase involved in cell wall biosynthesis